MVKTILVKSYFFGMYTCREELGTLAWFLIDVSQDDYLRFKMDGDMSNSFLEWFKKKEHDETCKYGDTIMALKRGDRVFIGSCNDDEEEDFYVSFVEENFDWSTAFETSRENIIKIIEDWYALLSMEPHPDEIIMIEEGENVSFEPRFYSESKPSHQGRVFDKISASPSNR